MTILIIFPFGKSMAADKMTVPISVEWTYEGQKWANSPHKSNIVIKPQDNAPMPSVSSFDYPGDYIVYFSRPNLTKPGKYEYLLYQTNQDFEEAGMSVTYDKTVYRLIFFVQQGQDDLVTSVYAYDDSKYNEDDENANKRAQITFINDDPHIHKNNGEIVDPNDPYHPFHPDNPWYPDNPTDPTNPYLPVEPNRPTDPRNPDRNEDNTPIYPTEPSDSDRPNEPINPSLPPVEGRDSDYWPERVNPNPAPEKPFPWWPWPWTDLEDDGDIYQSLPVMREKPWWWDMLFPEEEFVPNSPAIDPSDPTNPSKPVDPSITTVPWWWDILYPGIDFDPNNPDKPREEAPSEKPWWWDKILPGHTYDPSNPVVPYIPLDPKFREKPWWWDDLFPDEIFDPTKPYIDPSDPGNPTKVVDKSTNAKPWWWDILYPDTVFDSENPDKEAEKAPREKPWWWDKIFPDSEYNPQDLPKIPNDRVSSGNNIASGSYEDRFRDRNSEYYKYGNKNGRVSATDGDSNYNSKSNGFDKNSNSNVRTGIKSLSLWLVILIIAIIAYILTKKDRNNKKNY